MSEGGYVVPDEIRIKRKGRIALICRKLKIPYGWKIIHPYEDIIKGLKLEREEKCSPKS